MDYCSKTTSQAGAVVALNNSVRKSADSAIILPFGLATLRKLPIPHKYGFLDRIYGRALARHEVAFFPLATGVIWKLDARNDSDRFCVYGSCFSPAITKWLREFLKEGGVVIDAGANIGQTSAEFMIHPSSVIHAFEPVEECREWMSECLEMNKARNVQIVPFGLSDKSGTAQLQLAGDEEVHSGHSTTRLDWYRDKDYPIVEIPVLNLDEYAELNGISHIRFCKIDVEGAEWMVVQGAQNLLESDCIDAFLCEISSDNRERLPEFLSQFGYVACRPRMLGAPRRISTVEKQDCDVLFLSERVLATT